MATSTLRSVVSWPFEQIRGFLRNVRRLLGKLKPGDVLPPAVTETFQWLKVQVPRAFGRGSAADQMTASVVLGIASIFTSIFTGGTTLLFVTLFMLTFLLGALRLWPVVDRLWPLSSGGR